MVAIPALLPKKVAQRIANQKTSDGRGYEPKASDLCRL